ncbi:hypothetical protein ACTHSI_00490 [Neisseria sp. P0001.S004]
MPNIRPHPTQQTPYHHSRARLILFLHTLKNLDPMPQLTSIHTRPKQKGRLKFRRPQIKKLLPMNHSQAGPLIQRL